MRRIVVRAPGCGADTITYLRRIFRMHAGELQPDERVVFVLDAERFPFAAAIVESLLAGAGFTVLSVREEDGTRAFEARKG
ncbi:MAG: hypothetical protein ACREIN_03755 [Candidatus Methylomirabilaceae bacterium]